MSTLFTFRRPKETYSNDSASFSSLSKMKQYVFDCYVNSLLVEADINRINVEYDPEVNEHILLYYFDSFNLFLRLGYFKVEVYDK